jgi:hypothetical protein
MTLADRDRHYAADLSERNNNMKRILLAGAALGMMTTAGMAQTSGAQSSGHSSITEETTTITPAVTAPSTTSSSATTGRGATPDGDQTATSGSSFTDSNGVKTETVITNTSYPLANMITTTKKVTVIANGLATETVTTTNTYPHGDQNPPPAMTATRVYTVDVK